MKIPLELAGMNGLDFLNDKEIRVEEGFRAFDSIIEAATVGTSPASAARLAATSAEFDKQFRERFNVRAAREEKPAGGDGDILEKIYNPAARRKIGLTNYLRKMLAQGETAQGVIEHAQKHDPETADLFREIAREIEAA